MVLRFDRLVMSDGRRAPIHAEVVELYHAPSGEKVDVEGAIESGGRSRHRPLNQRSGAATSRPKEQTRELIQRDISIPIENGSHAH
jgi:hypothetical protein